MKIICKQNNLHSEAFASDTVKRLTRYISIPDGELNLEIDKEYVVYGIEFRDNCPWFYICTDDYDEYPTPFAADFFEITDKRLSAHWMLSFRELGVEKFQAQLVFAEWAADAAFYESLILGESHAVAVFEKRRKIMAAE
jgi:hypothetical protein